MSVQMELVALIATTGRAASLVAAHEPDTSGHCPVCPAGATGSGRVVSPCSLLVAARLAGDLCRPGCGRPRRLCGCLRLVEKAQS